MFDRIANWLSTGELLPHGWCLLTRQDLLVAQVASDALIAIAYFSIPLALSYFVFKRPDLKYRWMLSLFAIFIVACGMTHVAEIWTIWHPDYAWQTVIKAATATASIPTALLLWPLIPKLVALPSPARLAAVNAELHAEMTERERAVDRLTAETAERQRAEAQLRESEERLKLALAAADMVYRFHNLSSNSNTYSKEMAVLCGLPENTAQGGYEDFLAAVHVDDRERVRLAIDRAVKAGTAYAEEFRMLGPDGKLRWLSDRGKVFTDASGQATHAIGVAYDITERKQAEQESRRTQALLNSVVDNLPAMLFMKDAKDLRFVRFNKAAEVLTGWTQDELLGKNDYDFFPKDQADFFTQRDRMALQSGHLLEIPEEPIDTKYQGRRFLHTRKIPILDECGQPLYLLGISEDITERKQAEAALRESEERYRTLIEVSPQTVWQGEADGYINYCNQWWFDYTGLSMAQTEGQGWIQAIHPDYREQVKQAWLKTASTGTLWECEIPFRRASDGTYRWHAGRGLPVRDKSGKIVKWVGIALDMHDSKQADEALRESERFTRSVLDALPARICVLDEQGSIVAINKTWEDFSQSHLGHGEKTGIGANYLNVCDNSSGGGNDDALAVADGIRAVLRGDTDEFTHEYPCDAPEERFWFTVRVSRFHGEGPLRLVVTHQDITERKHAEDALRQHNALFSAVIDGTQDAVFMKDRQGRYLLANTALARTVRKPLEAIIGYDDTALFNPESAEFIMECDRQIMASGQAQTLEETIAAGGPAYTVLSTKVPHYDAQGELVGLVGICRDITAQKLAEQHARQQQAALAHAQRLSAIGEVTAIIAHELNQPLSAIASYIEGAIQRFPEAKTDGPLQDMLRETDKLARRAADVVRNIRAFVGKRELQLKPIAISQVLQATLDLVSAEARERQIGIHLSVAESLPLIKGDMIQLEQLFFNLIRNAMDAIDGHDAQDSNSLTRAALDASERRIRISSYLIDNNKELAINLMDTGGGLPVEILGRLFDPFVTSKPDGLGLGLSLCRSIAELHGGRIDAQNAPGEGASFTVHLPAMVVT